MSRRPCAKKEELEIIKLEQLAGNSFAKPVGNVSGFALGPAILDGPKCVQLLNEAAPDLSRIGVLLNPDDPNSHVIAIA